MNSGSVKFNETAFAQGIAKMESAVTALEAIKAPQCVDAGDEVQASLQAVYDKTKSSYVDDVKTRINQDITSLKNAGANYAAALNAITSSLSTEGNDSE